MYFFANPQLLKHCKTTSRDFASDVCSHECYFMTVRKDMGNKSYIKVLARFFPFLLCVGFFLITTGNVLCVQLKSATTVFPYVIIFKLENEV